MYKLRTKLSYSELHNFTNLIEQNLYLDNNLCVWKEGTSTTNVAAVWSVQNVCVYVLFIPVVREHFAPRAKPSCGVTPWWATHLYYKNCFHKIDKIFVKALRILFPRLTTGSIKLLINHRLSWMLAWLHLGLMCHQLMPCVVYIHTVTQVYIYTNQTVFLLNSSSRSYWFIILHWS